MRPTTVMEEPGGENLMALATTLRMTCCRRSGSTFATSGSSDSRRCMVCWLRASKGSSSFTTGWIRPRKSMRSRWKVPTVLSSLETSSKSFTKASMRCPAEWMSSNIPAKRGSARPRSAPSSAKPRMDCKGVRSSWLMLATNSDLARDASSAACRASWVARSASRNSLTSTKMLSTPDTWPCASVMAALITRVSRRIASACSTLVSKNACPPLASNSRVCSRSTCASSAGNRSVSSRPTTEPRSRPLYSSQARLT